MPTEEERDYDVAVGRIAAARAKGQVELDLSRLESLRRLPPQLLGWMELRALNLSSCRGLADAAPLAALTNLTTLDLADTWVTDAAPLAALANLTDLNLSSTGVTDAAPLTALTNLTDLKLAYTGVTDAAPLAALTNLTTLSLNSTRVTDVAPLAALANLIDLDLGHTGVTNAAPLAALTNLTYLILNYTKVTDATPLAALTNLTHLRLFACKQLTDSTPLAVLTNLTILSLSYSRGLAFAPLRPLLPRLVNLYLHEAQFTDLPPDVCSGEAGENQLDNVRAYYADLEAGTARDAEVKLFVLGNGRVGKTQLRRRLCGHDYDDTVPTTHGVQLEQFTLDGLDADVRVNLWDFGGQDIYHGSHALFLDAHAVFVVLWHPDFEDGEVVEGGVRMTNRPLAYWLDYVRSEAGPDAVVLVVQARCDARGDEKPLPQADLDGLHARTLSVSARTGRGLDVFRAELRLAVRDLLDARPPYQIGVGRAAVRDRLRAMIAADRDHEPSARRYRTLPRAAFAALCAEVGGVSSPDALLTFLHRSGVVFSRPGMFGDQIILDQQWALDAVYTVFDRARVLPVFRDHGRFTRTDLAHLAWQAYSVNEQKLFLGMMKECDICFEARERHAGGEKEPVYVAPELLPEDRDTVDRVLAGRVPRGRPPASANARLRFLHDGVLRSVLARVGRVYGDRATYWRWGCFLYDGRTDSRAVIEAARGGPADGPGGGTIAVRVWGDQPGDVLRALVQLVNAAAGRRTPAWDDERPVEPERAAPALVPAEPPDDERVVAISYGHGDDRDDKGRDRGRFVDGLEAVMPGWGIRPLRDVNELKNLGLIREFVLTIGRSRRVVLVLSEKYLRSAYCMSELHAVWQYALGDHAEFASRVAPCVLEADLGLGDWRGRKRWADHWRAEHAAMTAAAADLGRDDKVLWHEIGRWVQDVPDMLSFVSNMVAVRGFAALTADGYAAVRAMIDHPDRH
ncbi:MAG TPA: leucine-rich repeat domain-containing protein [Urbifossiella sp.]|nr:leucine-rich repeat domain-containing protein [Urbifossiella sp.]